jgi:pimeloyl-ACP methyl ester carboxylesterase
MAAIAAMTTGDVAVNAAMTRLLAAGGSAGRSTFTEVDGTRLHHVEAGAGPPVLLLHGGSGGGANWFRLLPLLADRHRVLAPDLPGFGLSDAMEARAPLGSAAAALLDRWLDALGVEGALTVGTSFGGLAALRLAQRTPHRVSRLLLLDSAGLGRGIHPLIRLAVVPGITAAAMRPTRRGTETVFRTLLTSNRSDLSAAQTNALVDYLHTSAQRAGTRYLARTLRLFCTVRGQREVVTAAELAALEQPVSVVWGELDSFLPIADAREAVRHCRDGRLVTIPDAGHSPNWETPLAVVRAIHELAAR